MGWKLSFNQVYVAWFVSHLFQVINRLFLILICKKANYHFVQ